VRRFNQRHTKHAADPDANEWHSEVVVDASLQLHPNMRERSGGLSLGRGFPLVSSTKQKLNTHLSTGQVVGADDFMPTSAGPGISWRLKVTRSGRLLCWDSKNYSSGERTENFEQQAHEASISGISSFTDQVAKGDVSQQSWCQAGELTWVDTVRPSLGRQEP
jgi:hypothetical protein